MADEQDNPEGPSPEEVAEALRNSELIAIEPKETSLEETLTLDSIIDFLAGKRTWAELIGMSSEEAYGIAHFGYQFYQDAKYHDAKTVFAGLIVCNPYEPYFHGMLGVCLRQLDLPDEALMCFNAALDLDDAQGFVLVNRAEMYLAQGKLQEAADDLKKAVSLDPETKESHTKRARALARAVADVLKKLAAGELPSNTD